MAQGLESVAPTAYSLLLTTRAEIPTVGESPLGGFILHCRWQTNNQAEASAHCVCETTS